MGYKNTTTLYKKERSRFLSACSLLVSVFVLYIYFVSASVTHVVMRQELNQEIAEINSHISQLESQYIEAQHEVSIDIASRNGYTKAEDKVFITRTPTSLVLSRNDEG